ncbi:hypothetical protein G6F59_017186 [Rhizopus arrhizus]|nr:hypothetical protein G6F59_017186 [Rhizopus arrhizus]
MRCGGPRSSNAALAAEQIQLPAGVEAELVAFTEHPLPTQLRIGLLAAVVAAACGDVLGLVETAFDEHRAGLADAGHGHAKSWHGVPNGCPPPAGALRRPCLHRAGLGQQRCPA